MAKTKSELKSGPKRSKSAYTFFWMEERLKVKEELPELNNNEIMSEVGKRWKALSTSDPKRLERLTKEAKADQDRYKQEKEALSNELVEEDVVVVEVPVEAPKSKKDKKAAPAPAPAAVVVEEPVKKSKEKSKGKSKVVEAVAVSAVVVEEPKKTKVNGYINFAKVKRSEVKAENPSLSPQDVTRELGRLWKLLSDEEKAIHSQ